MSSLFRYYYSSFTFYPFFVIVIGICFAVALAINIKELEPGHVRFGICDTLVEHTILTPHQQCLCQR